MSSTFQRLPTTIIPLNYDIYIQPHWSDPEPLGYTCTTRIQLHISDGSTREILLHSIGASLERVEFTGSDEKTLRPLSLEQSVFDVNNELVRLQFDECLAKGNGFLSITFSAQFCDVNGLGMKGMYRSKAFAADGSTRYNYLTFFAPTYARNAFPVFDEPEFKATFDVSLVVPKAGGLTAVSNMPLKSKHSHPENDNWIVKRFETSPKMSTYLVSWMIGEFDCLEDNTSRVPCRVFTPVGKKEQGEFALGIASKAIKFFDDYFSIPYPLPKLDLAAFGDFPCGAMENWGLITFREQVLLVDAKESSFRTRLRVGMIISHEIAHSWFGNLVTMKWWTDLYLNEGFATFMQFMCYNSMVEQLSTWDDFEVSTASAARELDSLSSSHPIEVTVNSPSDIDEIFDDISYKKGASIIAMLHDWIGDSAFRSGMSNYLQKYSYANAETADLWKELENSSGKSVGKLMDTFTKQMGFPLITISNVVVDKHQNQVRAKVSGKLFRLEQVQEKSTDSKLWIVPLTFVSYSSTDGTVSISGDQMVEIRASGEEQEIVFPITYSKASSDSGASTCLKFNRLGVGFYRVLYSDETIFHDLGKLIQTKVLPSQDRMNLLDDLFAVTASGSSSTKTLVEFLSYCTEEDNYFVWSKVSDILDKLVEVFADNDEKLKKLKALGQRLFSKTADRLGWDWKPVDSDLDILLRSLAIRKMIEFENPEHLSEGKRRFQKFEDAGYEIPADLRVGVYKAHLFGGGIETVQNLLKVYRKTDLLEEKLRILQSFQSVKDGAAQEFLLQFAISSEVRMQDAVSVMNAVSKSNSQGRSLAWEFFKTNWQLFQKQFTGLFIIGSLVRSITENFASELMEQEVESFFKEHEFRGVIMPVLQALESIRIKRAWIARIGLEEN